MGGKRRLGVSRTRRVMRPGPQGRLLWLAFSLALWVVLALAVQPAQAFTPFPVAGGASEHRRITDAALACRWADPSACWSAEALDRLEIALRRPDITLARDLLGWEPKVQRAEGLRNTLDYFRSLPREEWFKEAHGREF